MELAGTGIWSGALRWHEDDGEIADVAAELEQLGYTVLWVPGGAGGPIFDAASRLLRATRRLTVATGILNVWMHDPQFVAAQRAELDDAYDGRFLLGLGVSHARIVDRDEPGRYGRPLQTMRDYLESLDVAAPPVPVRDRVLAALGPRMLELSGTRAVGAHPYLVTTEHTRRAREILGPGPLLAPEQGVVLEARPDRARTIARSHLRHYFELPNYANNLRRLGYSDDDLRDGGSDRLVDALVAWGDAEAIAERLREHRAAGADHVCIQVLTEDPSALPRAQWRELAPAVTGTA